MTPRAYRDASAFRVSLETRLRRTARETNTPLDRLRKEVAHQRLLARLVRGAPDGSWALKGGQVLLARLGPHARTTKDADTTWRTSPDAFAGFLERAVDLDLQDYFTFEAVQRPPHGGGGRTPHRLGNRARARFPASQACRTYLTRSPVPILQRYPRAR